MEYTNKKAFARIYNRMFAFNTNYFCNNDEKVVYSELWLLQPIGLLEGKNKKVITTLDILTYNLDWVTPSKKIRGKSRVCSALKSLQEKGYISFDCDLKGSSRDVLEITIIDIDAKEDVIVQATWTDSNRNFKGFTDLKVNEYNVLKSEYDLSIYTYCKWRENNPYIYKICYKEWAEILGISERYAQTLINNSDVIIKTQGAFNKEHNKNETNSYKVNSNIEVEHLINNHVDVVDSLSDNLNNYNDLDTNLDMEDSDTPSIIESIMRKINDERVKGDTALLQEIISQDVYFTDNAFEILKTTKDKELKTRGNEKIASISKTEGGKKVIMGFETRYDKKVKEKKRKEKERKQRIDNGWIENENGKLVKPISESYSEFLNAHEEDHIERFKRLKKNHKNEKDISQFLD
ncbi:hypothetical protein [Vagococcus fluvialis]|uniref:hypothetical protein n=1 Tax=Vagococcus fluvialis TaxID=2738 RepID=UPI001A8E0F33|nr:hypothetical protein [Vagococcus fluvialis]MBO0487179.1 hypothetical protein [Vagococcus fluvialis]